jgi:hypothetical protein
VKPRHQRQHLAIAVAVNETHGNRRVREHVDRLAGHRSRDNVTAGNDPIDTFALDLVEYRLQRGQVAVYVVQGGDFHCARCRYGGWRRARS